MKRKKEYYFKLATAISLLIAGSFLIGDVSIVAGVFLMLWGDNIVR